MIRYVPVLVVVAALSFAGCRERASAPKPAAAKRPSILLVTLDTTRADSIGPEATGVETPAFNALAQRGMRFRQAYATAPQTLPSHSSMMTGLYPAGHGVHENGRHLNVTHPVLAEHLRQAGFSTAAFVSAFPVARRFGLARGFETYDDDFEQERDSKETTDRAHAWLSKHPEQVFLWVHYFDPHHPYRPSYLGEIAAMDVQLGRLVHAFESRPGPKAIIVAGDHGEALGEHGEAQHGNLLYQEVMQVPLLIAGPGVSPGVNDVPVSIRRVFHTALDWAGLASDKTLRQETAEVVLGEAMAPFLAYSWRPQVMAVEGRMKAIHAGGLEVYDVVADPAEQHDRSDDAVVSRDMRRAIRDYPIPAPTSAPVPPDDEARRRLASLGYITSDVRPVVRPDAPRPRDMVHLFDDLERASGLFERQEYAGAIPVLETILEADPNNLMTVVRLAVAHSSLDQRARAMSAFRRAMAIAPDSQDVRHYLALHYARGPEWKQAIPMLERALVESPDRLPLLEAVASLREREGRLEEALELREKIRTKKAPTVAEHLRIGELAMALARTPLAIQAFERARVLQGEGFRHHLELGVLYLSARRLEEARESLDRVTRSHPAYPMALFKRAQVSVLLDEPDKRERIELARRHADDSTHRLIASERLFR